MNLFKKVPSFAVCAINALMVFPCRPRQDHDRRTMEIRYMKG